MRWYRTFPYFLLLLPFFIIGCTNNSPTDAELDLTRSVIELEEARINLELEQLKSSSGTEIADESNNGTPQEIQTPLPPSSGRTDIGGITSEVEVYVPPQDALYFEDFSTSDEWILNSTADGEIRLSQNKLILTANDDKCLVAPIPNFISPNRYYIEALIWLDQTRLVGFAFGESPNFYLIGIADNLNTGGSQVQFRSPIQEVLVTQYDQKLIQAKRFFRLGIEVNNDTYSIYMDDQIFDTRQVDIVGNTLGLFTCNFRTGENQAHFDDLVILNSR